MAQALSLWLVALTASASLAHAGTVSWKNVKFPELKDNQTAEILVGDRNCKKGTRFTVELATGHASRAKWLMDRPVQLERNAGMLFVYPKAQVLEFWMKRTLIPLGIIFFDTSGKQVHSITMPVEQDPENPKNFYSSKKPAMAALEISPESLKALGKGPHYLCLMQAPAQK